jgi:hypothetical protein
MLAALSFCLSRVQYSWTVFIITFNFLAISEVVLPSAKEPQYFCLPSAQPRVSVNLVHNKVPSNSRNAVFSDSSLLSKSPG